MLQQDHRRRRLLGSGAGGAPAGRGQGWHPGVIVFHHSWLEEPERVAFAFDRMEGDVKELLAADYFKDSFFEKADARIQNWAKMGIKWETRDGSNGLEPAARGIDLCLWRRLREPWAGFQPSLWGQP